MSIDNAKTVFLNALEIASREARGDYLDAQCGDDPALRAEVEELLRHHEQIGPLGVSAAVVRTTPPPSLERPGTTIGPYKLLQQIGEGGMGVVYLAEQTEPIARRVALKIIKPGMDSRQVIARFEAERQALAMMDHVNIARVLDAGTTEQGRPYFVMELVNGVPITKYCDDNHLTPRQRLELFVPVCHAIQHAHQKGIIHRDIKPSNVMVTLYDGQAVPKVIDFGVAKATEQKLTERTLFTQYGTMVGTLEYMSPEQAEMSALGVDTRSDIYSLGVLLYELLTGSTPLSSQRMKEAAYAEILRMIKEEEPPKPSTRLSDSGEALASISANRHTEPARLTKLVRGELDWIVMKCLEKDRNRRYETANGFAMDVQRYLDDEQVQACPPSALYRFRKFARRNKATLLAASVIALAMLLGAGVSTWQAIRASAERDRALKAERKASVEKETTQAAFSFLWHDVLAKASPFHEADRDLKVRTLLERVEARLEKGSGQPALVEAAIRRMIGELHSDLGETTKARRHLEQSFSVQRRELGEEDPQTLAAMHSLGVCLYRLDQDDEAAILLGRTLELRRRVLGNEHDDTLLTMRFLGECYTSFQDRYEEAERLLNQALEIRSRVFGERHRETANTMHSLADVLGRRGKLKEAEVLGVRCVELSRQVFGDDDFVTQWAVHSLARTHLSQNDAVRAEPLAVEAVKSSRRIVGDQHATTHSAIAVLAYAYQLQEKHAEAAPLIAELLREPRNDESGLPRHYVIWGLRLLGTSLLAEKKYAEAESALRECLAFGKNRVPLHIEYLRTHNLLGASLLGQNKYAEAQPLLLESTQSLKQLVETQGTALRPLDRRYLTEALERMVQLYDAWGDKDAAARWRNELEVLKRRKDR